MLLTSLSIALIACIFGYKQSRELKRSLDELEHLKESLQLEIEAHNTALFNSNRE